MTTGVACGSCGTGMREEARFCDACGSQLAVSVDTAAQYKQVTVLFADVVRSMDIAAVLDVERLREVMTELVEHLAAVVKRYGGTPEYNGDGVMAIFGAPIALEDHAFRACLSALAIQEEANRLAAEVARCDGVDLRVRVGLNSGRVIAGEIGCGSLGYAAIGNHVGMAQRIESAAPPGGVMLSESTARLVEHVVMLSEPEWVHIKGSDEPVLARQLVAIGPREGLVGRAETRLIGRRSEMAVLDAMVDRAIGGRGRVVNVAGPPGIGKSRVSREAATLAAGRGVEVFWTFCESHTCDIPFGAVRRLLRTSLGVAELKEETARVRVRGRVPDADPQDLLLLDDLLGIADPAVPLPPIDPDARRRRLTALINTASLARTEPTLFVIEDAHWIDAASESMLADFVTAISRSPSMVLITARPEYHGALTRAHGAQAIVLEPLGDSDTAALLDELLGADPSVGELGAIIAARAAGNPFFTEEMVRELVQRGVLAGERGRYVCCADVAEVNVPATVQAVIEARIDRLSSPAKRTLNAASVIGARFGAGLLAVLGIDPVLDELLAVELIDQVQYTPDAEYAFRHPLIRAVAYESQLKSERAEMHRRLAAAIQGAEPGSVEENAALIAEHLQAAGELPAAYGWHMRAATWATYRDIAAARQGWERARAIADALPADDAARPAMRTAPRTLLCGSGWRGDYAATCSCFEELDELCRLTGDKASLAIGMTGILGEHYMRGRLPAASLCANEQMALVESISDPTLTVALSGIACVAKHETAEFADVLRWSHRVIDLAGDDPTKGNIFIGSPLAIALAQRAFASWALGRHGWRADFERAVATSRATDPISYAYVINTKYTPGITCGVLVPDATALSEITEALRIAERSADDVALGLARTALGVALVHRDSTEDRAHGLDVLEQLREMCMHEHYYMSVLHFGQVYIAREKARLGDNDGALALLRSAVDHMLSVGQLGAFVPAAATLVEALLERCHDRDLSEAEAMVNRLASTPLHQGFLARDVWLLRLRALIAAKRSNQVLYGDLKNRYRAMAKSLGFEGHIAWAEAMP